MDSMLTLAGVAGSDSILVERVRQHPNGARGVFFQLRAAGRTEDSAGGVALAAAERIAGAIAVAWSDSFYVREAIRFRELTPAQRRAIFSADSIADAGRAAVENDRSEEHTSELQSQSNLVCRLLLEKKKKKKKHMRRILFSIIYILNITYR